jgi:SPP1 family predicted phage head-tail adaptor
MTGRPTIGALRHRLRFEAPEDLQDGYGGFSRTYRDAGAVWARIIPVGIETQFDEQKRENIASYLIQIRWRKDIVPGGRFRFRDRIFSIRSVSDADERRLFLDCICEESS